MKSLEKKVEMYKEKLERFLMHRVYLKNMAFKKAEGKTMPLINGQTLPKLLDDASVYLMDEHSFGFANDHQSIKNNLDDLMNQQWEIEKLLDEIAERYGERVLMPKQERDSFEELKRVMEAVTLVYVLLDMYYLENRLPF